jgi:D-tyrosyl-tRNA(Tyr) deacylase
MRFVVQRVRSACVDVAGERVAAIAAGFLVLAGFGREDGPDMPASRPWRAMLEKLLALRVFPDQAGKMNLGLAEFGGEILVVSQFTLFADCRRGRRPSFTDAAAPDVARALYVRLCADLADMLPGRTQSGIFGADMDVGLVNWGPVTVLLDSRDLEAPR